MIFEGAQAANDRYIQDFPLMKEIVAELDQALTADDTEVWHRVQKACRMFNRKHDL